MIDVLIQKGLIFDGLGSAPWLGDVAIDQGRIIAIAPSLSCEAQDVIDASGLWVTPGFIDIHTHYDLELEIAPGLSESVRHGVTSVVIGNCSLSLAVGEPQMLADIFQRVETLPHSLIEQWLGRSLDWHTPREYLHHLDQLPLGPNVAPLLGHSALRAHVMGLERSLTAQPTPAELQQIQEIAEDALDAGFIGLSIDMFPWHIMSGEWQGHTIPSQHAEFNEYSRLAALCRQRDRVFQVTPNLQRLGSFWEILRLGVGLGRSPLRLTVLSALDAVHNRQLWRVFAPLLWIWNHVLGGNVRFQTLTEPFTLFSAGSVTPLFEEFPTGVQLNSCAGREERQVLWRSPTFRHQFRQDWQRKGLKSFHRDLSQMTILQCPESCWQGQSFAAVAAQRQQDPLEFFMEALQLYDTDLHWVATGANDRLEPRLALMRHPEILPGFTDAGAHVRHLGFYDGALSLLKQAVTTHFLSPEQAIHRVTAEPAHWFGLSTGTLTLGAQADVLLLNPKSLQQPINPPLEILDPILNGEPRMVKRNAEETFRAVYIHGVQVIQRDQVCATLGRDRLGRVLTPQKQPSTELSRQSRRNAISDSISDHPFTDYWDIFVLKHQHPVNIALHILGIGFFYGLIGLAVELKNPGLLLGLPLTQAIGLIGHLCFERSHIDRQDAIFSWRASSCLGRLLWRVVLGQYGEDIRQRRAMLAAYLHSSRGDNPDAHL